MTVEGFAARQLYEDVERALFEIESHLHSGRQKYFRGEVENFWKTHSGLFWTETGRGRDMVIDALSDLLHEKGFAKENELQDLLFPDPPGTPTMGTKLGGSSRYHAMPEVPGGYYGIWDSRARDWHIKPKLTPSEAFALEEKLNREIGLGIAFPEELQPRRVQRGPGYDLDLPSIPPFMYIERHEVLGDLGVIAYGAYSAFGLVGPEKGGVAIVFEAPERYVLATKDFPYNPAGRAEEAEEMVEILGRFLKPASRGGKKVRMLPAARADELIAVLQERGYGVRGYQEG